MTNVQDTGHEPLFEREQTEAWNISHTQEDFKYQILTKFFPSIRYGRDTDLDRYLSLRERGKPLKEWKSYYDNLARKYTESERVQLIQSFRKRLHHFQYVFKQILEGLYNRVEALLKQQIDTLLSLFKDILGQDKAVFANRDFFTRIGQALQLFSTDRYEALSHLDLLADFARKTRYQADALEQVAHFIKGYLNGSLFLEAKRQEAYHFDINEEKAQSPFRPKSNRVAAMPLQLFLTTEDLDKIVLDGENLNEYELCFAYLDKYMRLLGDEDFATKIFVYSKKYRTIHYQIFDRIRQGIHFNHQKERIFDDIFKIVCAGRYVYNIKLEKFISYKLRLLTNTLTKPQTRKALKQESRRERSSPSEPRTNRATRKLAAKERKIRKKAVTAARKPGPRMQIDSEPRPFRTTLSVTEMIKELSEQKHVQKRLNAEFKKRLPAYIREACSFGQSPPARPGDNQAKQLDELIRFVMQNYDNILTQHEQTDIYYEQLEQLGSSLHTIYTAILNCLNKLKTDYFTHRSTFEKPPTLFIFGG